ncbi:hypothetical protein [Methanoregula sp.]|uniref:hypothetical protein n=1 Tax=Methanoregula sp. TaxID=2052170 RepID=UPI00236DABC2|nr:hypothetical protein [Methanoregula sp.]MDD1687485.1 hypothetical protein [Methanoregula sp.]
MKSDDTPFLNLLKQNPKLERVVLDKFSRHHEYLSSLDNLIADLERLDCRNIGKKIQETNALDKFSSLTAEFMAAKKLAEHGFVVTLLSDDFFGKSTQSPDIHGEKFNKSFYFEVTRFSDSNAVLYIIEELREFLKDKPFIVNTVFKTELALPAFSKTDRTVQKELAKNSMLQFKEHVKKITVEDTPQKFQTDGIEFTILPADSTTGYPGILSSGWKFPEEVFELYVTGRLLEKACKRSSFKKNNRKIPYILVFLSDDSSIDEMDFKMLLYGRTIEYGIWDSGDPQLLEQMKIEREKQWRELVKNKRKYIQNYCEIESASNFGWKKFLEEMNLIPKKFCYLNKVGLFLSNPLMKNVSGIILITKSERLTFYPNPFCYSEINDIGISKNFNF